MPKTRTPTTATLATAVTSRGDVTQPLPNEQGNFTVQPMQQAVVEGSYGDAAETPMPKLDVAKLTEIRENGRRMVRGPIAVANVKSVLEEHDYPQKHLRALDLYEKARSDYRDLKLAEHEVVRRRDEAIAMVCERMVGKVDNPNDGRAPKKDNTLYKHSATSATAWAYEHDEKVTRLQAERDAITVSLFHAECALDIAERALKATGYLIERNNAGTLANTQSMLAKAVEDLPKRLIEASSFIAAELKTVRG